MEIKLTIAAEPAVLNALNAIAAGLGAAAPAPEAAPPRRTRGGGKKTDPKPDPAPETAAAGEGNEDELRAALSRAFIEFGKANGRPAAKEILARFDAKKVSDIKAGDLAAAMAAIRGE